MSIANISALYAENNQSWYERAKDYSSSTIDTAKDKASEYGTVVTKTSKDSWETTKKYTNETVQNMTTDDVTFESFYKESSSIGWIIAGVLTIIAVAAIVFTGGTASPIVAGVGTWIGGTMGLSGAAATNAGLALLGGGSIASGGFGIIGGTVVLTAAFTFGTEVVIDYTVSKAFDMYSYSNFSKDSKDMMTLPLPKNNVGCNAYEEAMSLIGDIDSEIPISSERTQLIVKKAIEVLGIEDENIDLDEKAKKEALYGLLNFITNDFKEAKKHAKLSMDLSDEAGIVHTLPSYIYATSSLYDETFNYNELADRHLKYSMLNEPDNPIIPLLLSIHLDRMMYRFGDGIIDEKALKQVFNIISNESLQDFRLQNYIILLSRYAIRLKLEQQKISSLSTVDNKTIKNSPKTLLVVKKSFKSYGNLIHGANDIIKSLEILELEDEKDVETKKQVETFKELIVQYDNDKTRLQGLILDLAEYQTSLTKEKIKEVQEINVKEVVKDNKNIYLYIGLSIILLILVWFLIANRRKDDIGKDSISREK